MTVAGQAQAAAAKAIAPALAAFNRSLARTRNAGPAECARIASNLRGCLGTLATAVNSTGYAASGQWRGEFLQGQASDPDWLNSTAHSAAQRIQDAANLTIAIRAVRPDGASVTLPVMRAGHILWKACHDLDQLMLEHRRAGTMPVARVFRDRASGLREGRPGLEKMLSAAAERQVTVVRVTHEDRLARFGAGWLRRLLAVHGTVQVLHPKAQGGREELLEGFISLVTTSAGRLYGMRSAAACKRLLAESDRYPPGGGR